MHFKHLRITGFKSFAEPEEIDIEDGLTGIVGPNGCGKSNIVEALRWVMGESSTRSIRGDELDDIIFAGTSARPPRNFAEVTLTLDNTDRHLAAYSGDDTIEITRRVDRGKGSDYRINGKPARARDVQLLFADISTGARSHGIVGQGKVAALIGAKPTDRRSLLEEAANTRGLHHRRHEANLRINTAERNLTRVDDILQQLDEQKSGLVKQARQAARYRSIAERIRKAEAQLLDHRYRLEMRVLETVNEAKRLLTLEVADATKTAGAAERAKDEAATAMPSLRETTARDMAEKQRLDLAMAEIANEAARIEQATSTAKSRLNQLNDDIKREKELQMDAASACSTASAELTRLNEQSSNDEPTLRHAEEACKSARITADQAEAHLADATVLIRAATRDQSVLETQRDEIKRRLDDTQTRLAALDVENDTKTAQAAAGKLKDTENAANDKSAARDQAGKILEKRIIEAREATARATEARNIVARTSSEIEAITAILTRHNDGEASGEPVSASVTVRDGMEHALAAAFDDGLAATSGASSGSHWRNDLTIEQLSCPQGATPLAAHIEAPKVLLAALSGVGVAANASEAKALQSSLKPGQVLTTKDGGLWRWDGFVRPEGATQGAAERLRQETRLKALRESLDDLEKTAAISESKAHESNKAQSDSEAELNQMREDENTARTALIEASRHYEQTQAAVATSTLQHKDLSTTQTDLKQAQVDTEAKLLALTNHTGLKADMEAKQTAAEQARARLAEAMSEERNIKHIREVLTEKEKQLTQDISTWQARRDGAGVRLSALTTRLDENVAELDRLAGLPEVFKQKREDLAEMIEAVVVRTRQNSDRLAEAEQSLSECEARLRQASSLLTNKREELIRQESDTTVAQNNLEATIARIGEKLGITPDKLDEIIGDENRDKTVDSKAMVMLESRLNRLLSERDNIGAVNLRAEDEVIEIETRITNLTTERDDLLHTIEKLRVAIGKLNREGQERLLKSFTEVNKYFEQLFKTLFNGGHAELVLIDSDDPLEAGLDILASPPGKKMQSLALLSGGEQALTALALIFAVFLTNPAPICILDEVDAPLDDRNVGRFCAMIDDIVRSTPTRFMIVTHHRFTMARMDKLYGITMEEKGVSQVVSVDLQSAVKYRQSA